MYSVNGYVVDVSVFVEVCVRGNSAAASDAFLRYVLQSGVRLYAPEVIYYEFLGALRKYELNAGYIELEKDLTTFLRLDLTTFAAKNLLPVVANIARRHKLSTYDAFYLAVAQQENVPLVSVDRRLINGCAGKGFNILHVDYFVEFLRK